jgi:lipoprotein signal peptidase
MNARAALFLAFIVVVCADEGAKFCARRMFDAPHVIGAATLSAPAESELAFPSALHHRSVRYALYALAAVALVLLANAARTSVPISIALGLLAGGAAAGMIDRVRHGGVTDFALLSVGGARVPINPAELAFALALLVLAFARPSA